MCLKLISLSAGVDITSDHTNSWQPQKTEPRAVPLRVCHRQSDTEWPGALRSPAAKEEAGAGKHWCLCLQGRHLQYSTSLNWAWRWHRAWEWCSGSPASHQWSQRGPGFQKRAQHISAITCEWTCHQLLLICYSEMCDMWPQLNSDMSKPQIISNWVFFLTLPTDFLTINVKLVSV